MKACFHVRERPCEFAFEAQRIDGIKTSGRELRRAQPNISLAWIDSHMLIAHEAERAHYLEAFRRAGPE